MTGLRWNWLPKVVKVLEKKTAHRVQKPCSPTKYILWDSNFECSIPQKYGQHLCYAPNSFGMIVGNLIFGASTMLGWSNLMSLTKPREGRGSWPCARNRLIFKSCFRPLWHKPLGKTLNYPKETLKKPIWKYIVKYLRGVAHALRVKIEQLETWNLYSEIVIELTQLCRRAGSVAGFRSGGCSVSIHFDGSVESGWRENLQDPPPYFLGISMVSGEDVPLNHPIDHWEKHRNTLPSGNLLHRHSYWTWHIEIYNVRPPSYKLVYKPQ